MSAEAVGWVWRHSPVAKSALLVHLALADVTNDMHGNQLWCSTDTLCRKTRLSRRAVMVALDQLVSADLLVENERPGRTTLYRFEFPDLPEQILPPYPVEGEQNLPPGEQSLDPTRAESASELNRTQANNPAPATPIFTDLDDFEYLKHERNPEALASLRDRFKQRADLA